MSMNLMMNLTTNLTTLKGSPETIAKDTESSDSVLGPLLPAPARSPATDNLKLRLKAKVFKPVASRGPPKHSVQLVASTSTGTNTSAHQNHHSKVVSTSGSHHHGGGNHDVPAHLNCCKVNEDDNEYPDGNPCGRQSEQKAKKFHNEDFPGFLASMQAFCDILMAWWVYYYGSLDSVWKLANPIHVDYAQCMWDKTFPKLKCTVAL
ncbi:hypothetical protein PAXINDRAFT_15459 [Paxillus involutus ATCC 200175]|uniref:Unplaced genomic scaffold PAXINscaffold_53, whole genome shotgun sequence n=1 Tax=Paxillus involutus ATCC 200175 TaxID=664439 RepID=A0A0C9T7I9_PAXIN|nr:hypothetical protein PAXINDRAFT_15459 [Paxillus involutus ATCC 200175]